MFPLFWIELPQLLSYKLVKWKNSTLFQKRTLLISLYGSDSSDKTLTGENSVYSMLRCNFLNPWGYCTWSRRYVINLCLFDRVTFTSLVTKNSDCKSERVRTWSFPELSRRRFHITFDWYTILVRACLNIVFSTNYKELNANLSTFYRNASSLLHGQVAMFLAYSRVTTLLTVFSSAQILHLILQHITVSLSWFRRPNTLVT